MKWSLISTRLAGQQAVTQAKANVAQAQLDLLEEQTQGEQAKSGMATFGFVWWAWLSISITWATTGTSNSGSRERQTWIGKRLSKTSEKNNLSSPLIRWSWAVMFSRGGHGFKTGAQIATLYSVDEVEVSVPLFWNQWLSLPNSDNT